MKKAYQGEILKLNTKEDYDYIKINNKKLRKNGTYHIPLELDQIQVYDNYIKYEPVNTKKLVINYIKNTKHKDSIGILKYREFCEVEALKDDVVSYDVYDLEIPFKFTEYYDGTYIHLKFTDVKIQFEVHSNGLIEKVSEHVYKIVGYVANNIILSGNNFYYLHSPKFVCKYRFNLSKCTNKLQIKIFTRNILDKYLKTNDTKKEDVLDLLSKLNIEKDPETSLIFFDLDTTHIVPRYVQDRIYFVKGVLIYNITKKENLSTSIESKTIKQNGNLIIYDSMKILVKSEFLV
jgi:hypothetical protein